MKFVALVLVLAVKACGAVDPVGKVVQMLGELHQKITNDGAAQQEAFDKYVAFCKDGVKDTGFEITTHNANIEDLDATVKKATADGAAAAVKIESLASAISTNSADVEAAKEIRERESNDFNAAEKELVETIDTLERATNALQRKLKGSALLETKVDKRDVASLIRMLSQVVEAASLSIPDRKHLLALAQQGTDDDQGAESDDAAEELGAPAAAAYASHSSNIVDVLEDLQQKAVSQVSELRKAESSARNNYELMKQSLEDQMKADTASLSDAKGVQAEAGQTKAANAKDLAATKASLAEAETVLKNMNVGCMTAAADHEQSVKGRQEELSAISEAIKVLKETTSGAVAITYNSGAAASFLQIDKKGGDGSRLLNHADLVNFEVLNLVRKLAREQKSAALAQLAGSISTAMRVGGKTGEDPFAKVKAMINAMLEKMEKAAGEEASHKAYCDKEYGDTESKTQELKYDIQKFSAKLDKARSESAKLKSEVAELQSSIAATIKAQAEADTMRHDDHGVYVQTKADLESGLEGVRMALKVLREYYASDSSTEFTQQPEAPVSHSKSSGAGTGVIGLLEVVESDLGKGVASVEMQEQGDATEYERVSMDNKLSRAQEEKDVQYKTKEAASLDKSATELSSDLDGTQTELDAVLDYTKNIRAMCEVKPESYEERVARRNAEVAGLKEALTALEGQGLQLWQHHRRSASRKSAHRALRGLA